jgi:polyhydroxybutyrate depolymerase
MTPARPLLPLLAVLALAGATLALACGDDDTPAGTDAAAGSAGQAGAGGVAGSDAAGQAGTGGDAGEPGEPTVLTIGGDRPTKLVIPSSYNGDDALPLVVMLHGYGASGGLEELYLHFKTESEAQGFLYVAPDGTSDASGKKFWNATKACCNFGGSDVDDEGYLIGLLDEIEGLVNVDKKRVYFFGHSNGGFMTYRMACNHADRIAAVGVLAGAMVLDPEACKPSEPVSVLHVHGTADDTILYEGGSVAAGVEAYPGAEENVARWLLTDACGEAPPTSTTADFVSNLDGEETTKTVYGPCQNQTEVALWSLAGGSHIPGFNGSFSPAATSWLLAHAKP